MLKEQKVRKYESCKDYGKDVPMYKFEEVVLDNGAVVQKVVQMSKEEILEKSVGCNAYGDAMEAKSSQFNDYHDTFEQYDMVNSSIDNIKYEVKQEEKNDE